MSWQCARLTYELRSPLHIGYHRIGNVQRTRCYVPARNLWAAVTERLTRNGFSGGLPEGDYEKIGDWVAGHLAFTYFFVSDGDELLYPKYDASGLTYGGLPRYRFERRYLSAHVTTALDAGTGSAETGSLHEVEYVAHRYVDDNQQPKTTRVAGWVFFDEEAYERLGSEAIWEKWLGDLWVGGERRYGFGHLRLCQDGWKPYKETELLEGYALDLNGSRPKIIVSKDRPLLAHVPVGTLAAKGAVEPLVGRETSPQDSTSFGKRLTSAVVCWTPGTTVTDSVQVEIRMRDGLWKSVEMKDESPWAANPLRSSQW